MTAPILITADCAGCAKPGAFPIGRNAGAIQMAYCETCRTTFDTIAAANPDGIHMQSAWFVVSRIHGNPDAPVRLSPVEMYERHRAIHGRDPDPIIPHDLAVAAAVTTVWLGCEVCAKPGLQVLSINAGDGAVTCGACYPPPPGGMMGGAS